MSADAVVSRELTSLQDEMLVTQKERAAAAASPRTATAAPAAPPTEPIETVEDPELRDQLRELASEVTGFFGEAEKTISTHPVQSVAGALLVGILIGRLIGRR
jgi:ElaB/YqjD/DUF883 family membrane-anchored ribosome-binding protein